MDIVVPLIVQVASAAWVFFDARKRDWSGDGFADAPWKWALGTAFLWILAFPFYLLRRGKRPRLSTAV